VKIQNTRNVPIALALCFATVTALFSGCSVPRDRVVGRQWISVAYDECTDKTGKKIKVSTVWEFFPDGTLRLTTNAQQCAEDQDLKEEVLMSYRFPDKNHIITEASIQGIPVVTFYEVEVSRRTMALRRPGQTAFIFKSMD
jgi:hypothetical protein